MTVQVSCTIGGKAVPIYAFDVTGGSHGAVGHATIDTSIAMLTKIGLDLPQQASEADDPLPVQISVTPENGGAQKIFDGELTSLRYVYREDAVQIMCGDKARRMVDEKRVLAPFAGDTSRTNAQGGGTSSGTSSGGFSGDTSRTNAQGESGSGGSGVNTQNQTISQFVSQVASMYGLTPVLSIAEDFVIGTIFGDSADTILTAIPQTIWGFLTKLARDTGNEVHATPKGELIFGRPPVQGGSTLTISWMLNPPPGDAMPAITFEVTYNPARNLNHKVTVNSYDPTKAEVTTGTKVKGRGQNRFTFHTDGLTAEQARRRADAISRDIEKRAIVVTAQIDFKGDIVAMMPAKIVGQIDPAFLNTPLYLNQYSHIMRMPAAHETHGGGGLAELSTVVTLMKVGEQ